MAAYGVTASDVFTALGNNNYLAALGTTKGQMVTVDLTADTDLHSVEEFKKLVIKQMGGAIVRLEDVANVTLGAENYDFNVASAAATRCSSASRPRRMPISSTSPSACAPFSRRSRRRCPTA